MEAVLTLVEKTAMLKAYPVFGAVPTEALAVLAARSQERHFDAGTYVWREGDPNRATVMVVEGKLEVRKRDKFFRIVDTGEGFGQLEVPEGAPTTVSVLALEHTHVIWVTVEELFESISDNPEIGVGLIRLLATRVQELLDHILILEEDVGRLVGRLREAGVALPGQEQDTKSNGAASE